MLLDTWIYAEVVTRVAGSLDAGGLPGYPKSKINMLKTWQSFVALYFHKYWRREVLNFYTNILYMFYLTREKNDTSVQVEGWRASPS